MLNAKLHAILKFSSCMIEDTLCLHDQANQRMTFTAKLTSSLKFMYLFMGGHQPHTPTPHLEDHANCAPQLTWKSVRYRWSYKQLDCHQCTQAPSPGTTYVFNKVQVPQRRQI